MNMPITVSHEVDPFAYGPAMFAAAQNVEQNKRMNEFTQLGMQMKKQQGEYTLQKEKQEWEKEYGTAQLGLEEKKLGVEQFRADTDRQSLDIQREANSIARARMEMDGELARMGYAQNERKMLIDKALAENEQKLQWKISNLQATINREQMASQERIASQDAATRIRQAQIQNARYVQGWRPVMGGLQMTERWVYPD
jgi:hypothetical protein